MNYDNKYVLIRSLILTFLIFACNSAIAGPSLVDMDYSVSRPLIVEGTVRGAYRFDIIRPATWDNLPNGNSPEWYSDELLVVRNIASAEVVFSRSLKSGTVEFLVDGLSNNYIVFTEWSGGSSCCLLVSAFEVTENFKVLLDRHNNDFFDKTTIIINGTDRLQLHRDLVQDPDQPHSMLKNQPSVFDLKMGKWKK